MISINNNVKYIFLRHGKLDLPYKNHSEMPISVLIEIASGKINPSVDVDFINEKLPKLELVFKNIDSIVVSPLKRGIETGQIIREFIEQKRGVIVDFFIENNLKEVSFDIEEVIKDLESIPNLSQLNNLVFEAMSGLRKGSETSVSTFNRVKEVIKKYNSNDKTILVVTHSFLLESLEMYINNKNVENFTNSYEELIKSPKVNYLSGFTTDKDLNIINFISV